MNPKSTSDIMKLKLFMDVFNRISGEHRNYVDMNTLMAGLMLSDNFATVREARESLTRAMHNAQIYEIRSGVYSRP